MPYCATLGNLAPGCQFMEIVIGSFHANSAGPPFNAHNWARHPYRLSIICIAARRGWLCRG
jgi:hypothetical protein